MTGQMRSCGFWRSLTILLLLAPASFRTAAAQSTVKSDPLLQAMLAEMERSKAQLKMDQLAAPFYIDYRVIDVDEYDADAAFGALLTDVRIRHRALRVVVRLGDYKHDSYFGAGQGTAQILPVDNEVIGLRHQLWLATDQAYKTAAEALSAKQALLKQFNVDQQLDDFAHAEPVQSLGPLATLEMDTARWQNLLRSVSALYKTDLQTESIESSLKFQAVNRYFVSSEGTILRSGQNLYELHVAASAQASDGMRIDRSHGVEVDDIKQLPSDEEFRARTAKMMATLKELRAAPVVDEDYHGPVLFAADPAAAVFANLVGENVLGIRPRPGQSGRTTGAFANSYKSRVLPDFLSVVDDPTISEIAGQPLLGSYQFDDEGVRAMRVPVIDQGKLVNYLVGREPILDFATSNGHGRARVAPTAPGPGLGNLIVTSAEPVPPDDLRKKLVELCRQRQLPYGYYVEATDWQLSPRLLYRVWVKDGRQELVRGATFGDLDARALRNDLIAAGNDVFVDSRVTNIPHSIVSPSILFDELEIKRANKNNDKLPEYSAPSLASPR
jgi:predicted Zn-dependent protease